MKFFTNKETTKKVIIAILLVMSFNFISPNISIADDTPQGGKLFEPLFQFTCFIGDLFIKGMQWIFMGDGDIKAETDVGTSTGDSEFNILYSPGVIFSNKVPALDVDFFSPNEYDVVEIEGNLKSDGKIGSATVTIQSSNSDEEKNKIIKEGLTKVGVYNYGYDTSNIHKSNGTDFKELYKGVFAVVGMNPGSEVEYWEYNEKIYALEKITVVTNSGFGSTTKYEYKLYSAHRETKTGEERESSATTLQKTVSTWYKALRAFALVGLLSVLVYIGIRILISSTGQEKAKYKKMIMDWVAAICILFVLQYIMIFTLKITERITKILSVSVIGEDGRDNLMSDIRGRVGGDDETEIDYTNFKTFINTIMYLALVIETGIFSVHYLKRLVYMAFFTMIAPLVALTYPLDKIKDGQAQAFGTLIREYIFNALIQPVHLLLYYIFISSASSLVDGNPLYAVVALGFMMPAEKFFRKMFGFEKASSVSQVGAAAGGALVMNAINKMGQKSGKQAAGKSSGESGSSGGASGSTPRYAATPDNGIGGGKPKNPPKDKDGNPIGTAGHEFGQDVAAAPKSGKANLWNGAKTLAGHYNQFNKPNATRNAKALGRGVRKGLVGAAGAATLGTIGLAAGVATGDLGNALKYGAAGAGAGYMGANALGDKATELEKKNREMFKEGAFGTAEYNKRNSIKELTNDHDFNNLCKAMGVTNQKGREVLIRQFHENGITKPEDIKKAMNAGANTENATRDEVIAAAKIRKEAERYGYKKKDVAAMVGDNEKALNLIDLMW